VQQEMAPGVVRVLFLLVLLAPNPALQINLAKLLVRLTLFRIKEYR
jgi:hypothetical protein